MDKLKLNQLRHKKILVTGATGFVGSHLTRRLVELGLDVTILKRHNSNTSRIKDLKDKIETVDADLRDINHLRNALSKIKPEIVFHFATYGNFSHETDKNKIIATNLNGTKNLIEILLDSKIKLFINTGSSSEYGKYDTPMSELLPLNPVSTYGLTKASVSLLCTKFYETKKFPVTTLRLFTPYGPFDHPSRLIPSVITSILMGDDLNLTGGEQERDYIFIDDVIDAYIKVTEVTDIAGKVINIGSGKGTKVRDIANNIKHLSGYNKEPNWGALPYRDDEIFKWSADIRLAKELLNWRPRTTLEDGLKKTYEWFKENKKLFGVV